eukprot:g4750.t1
MSSVVDDVLVGLSSPSRDNMSSIMGISPVNKKNANVPSTVSSGTLDMHNNTNASIDSTTIQQREIVRIHELWQKAKAELRSKSRELADLRGRIAIADTTTGRVEMQLNELSRVQHEALELREVLRSTEEELEQKRLENDRWHRHAEHLKQKLRDAERKIAESNLRQQNQASRIREFESRLTQIESEKANLLSRSLNDIRNQEEDMASLQRKLQLAQERIRIQNDTITQHQTALAEAEKNAIDSESRALRSERAARTFEQETDMSRGMIRDYKQAKRSEEALRYEIEHLKLDNARMVRLLSTTKEYKEFLEFAENSRGITFVPSKGDEQKTSSSKHKKSSSRATKSLGSSGKGIPQFDKNLVGQKYGAWGDVSVFSKVYGTGEYADVAKKTAINPSNERDNWMPTDALHLAIDFRQRHMPHVSMDLINEFLQQMNEVWRRRGVRAVARAKAKFANDLKNYKRANSHRLPYAEVVQKQKIAQLTKELENLRSKVGISGGRGKVSSITVAREQKMMQNTLFTVEKLSREVNEFAMENKKLQDELRLLQSQSSQTAQPPAEKQDHDFMEGAAWFGRNSVHIMDRLTATVAQYCRDVQSRSNGNDDALSNGLSQIEFVVNQCKTRMRRLFEGTLDAEGDASKTNQLAAAMPLSGHRSSLGDEIPRALNGLDQTSVGDNDLFRAANASWASNN